MSNPQPEIAYILKGFPRTSETFITNEIYLLEQAGLALTIFSIKRLEGQKQHGVVERIKAPIHYLPETTSASESQIFQWVKSNWSAFAPAHQTVVTKKIGRYLITLLWVLWLCLKYRTRAFIKEFFQAVHIAARILQQTSIRHLHGHFAHTTTTVTMIAASLCDLPFSFTAHAKDIYAEGMNPGDLLQVKMQRAAFVVTCTKANELYLQQINPAQKQLHAIYHGLDLTMFRPLPKDPNADALPNILAVGRLVEKKGFTYLVEACAQLRQKGIAFRCQIVGGEDKYAEVIKVRIADLHLQDVVQLVGAVTQEELREIYRDAMMFVLPCQVIENGDRDGIPNVLVESMAMELPVISTHISGIPELIDQDVNGIMVAPQDATALAQAIERLLVDESLRLRLGKAARTKVIEQFDSTRNVHRLKSLFESVMRR